MTSSFSLRTRSPKVTRPLGKFLPGGPLSLINMPYKSCQPQGKHTEEDVFVYIKQSMEVPMGDSEDVADYHHKFLELVEPLLNKHLLDQVECDILFWYGFHPEDRAMLLRHLSSSRYQSATSPSNKCSIQRMTSSHKDPETYKENSKTHWSKALDTEEHATTGAT